MPSQRRHSGSRPTTLEYACLPPEARGAGIEHGRDRDVERAFMAAAGASAEYCDAVQARLDQHGHTITTRPVRDALIEAAEEALDLAGWALVARTNTPSDVRERHPDLLEAIVLYGHNCWSLIQSLQELEWEPGS